MDNYLVETTIQVDNNLASSVIIDDLEFANVTVFHHHGQEFDDDLRAGSQQHLSLVSLLSVAEGFQGIGQRVHAYHFLNLSFKVETGPFLMQNNHIVTIFIIFLKQI